MRQWFDRVFGGQGSGQDDWALWQRAHGGDEAAARALVQRLTPQAFGLARQMLSNASDAEDAVQDAFLRLWSSRPERNQGARLSTYFNTIVLNRCKTVWVQRREWATEPASLADLLNIDATVDPVDAPLQIQGQQDAQRVRAAVLTLSPRQRMAIGMWAYSDASVTDIAVALGVDHNAAHQLLHRAKNALRLRLERGDLS